MKKTIIAVAACFPLAQANAQMQVTVYGTMDAGMRYVTNINAAGDNIIRLDTGNSLANRWGVAGSEDLGGGMQARFRLEGDFAGDTGALAADGRLFGRTASVGIGGAWGAIDLGRQYTVAFKTVSAYNPLVATFPVISPTYGLATAGNRNDNAAQYTGNFGDLTVRTEYAFGELAGSVSNGAEAAIGMSYEHGPYGFGGAFTQRHSATGLKTNFSTLGVIYKDSAWRATLGYETNKAEGVAFDTRNRSVFGGGGYQLTPLLLLNVVQYNYNRTGDTSVAGKRKMLLTALTYSLSKRTNLYLEADFNRFDGKLITAKDTQTGISTGVLHRF